jgi:hypothetical protein
MVAKKEEILAALITQKIHDLHRGFSFLFGWFIEKLQLILQLQL